MSFSSSKLNSPHVVGTLGLTCFVSLPFLKGTFEKTSVPWVVVQGVNLCAFGLSFWSVTQPGREAEKAKKLKEADVASKSTPSLSTVQPAKTKKKKKSIVPRVRTLLPPDGWSFLIWAPIFVGESLMVGTQVAVTENSPLVPIIRQITGPYLFAKVFQILWNTSFSPAYQQGVYKYIAAVNLSGLALSLSFCHQAYTEKEAREKYGVLDFLLNFLPLSLHFGWTTATSLVNWNASYAIDPNVPTKNIAYLGHASVVAATAAGVGVTLTRTAPIYGTVIAWALSAVASGLTKKIEGAEKDKDDEFILAAQRQRTASAVGALLCITAALTTAFRKRSR